MTFSPPNHFPAPRPRRPDATALPAPTPTVEPAPSSTPPTAAPLSPTQESSPGREWSPVGVISALGVIFVLISGLSVTLRQWGNQGEAVRAIGLTVLAVAATLLADRIRAMAHTTALATAVLGAALGFPAGVALAAWAGQPWPICLTAGASIAVPFAEWQRRRWAPMTILGRDIGWFDLIQVATVAMGSFGVAAWTHVPAGVVAVLAAAVMLALGATRRGVAVALIAVAAPVLGVLADAGIGAGTLARAGVVGSRLGWAGPLVGLVAGGVILLAGRRLGNRRLQLIAPPVVLAGCLTGLAVIDVGPAVWLSIPGLLLAVAAGTWHVGGFAEEPFGPPVTNPARPHDPVETFRSLLIAGACGAAAVVWLVSPAALGNIDGSYAITGFVWALGLGLCWPIAKRVHADLILAGLAVTPTIMASALGSIVVAPGRTDWLVPVVVALVSLAAAGIATRSAHTVLGAVLPLATGYLFVVGAIVGEDWTGGGRVVPFGLVAVWLMVAVLAFARFPRPAAAWVAVLGLAAAVGAAVAMVATEAFVGSPLLSIYASIMFAAVATSVGCAAVPSARPITGLPIAVAGSIGLLASRSLGTTGLFAASFALAALVMIAWARSVPSPWSSVLAGGTVGAALIVVAATFVAGAKLNQLIGLAVLAASVAWVWWRDKSLFAVGSGVSAALALLVAAGLPLSWLAATWCGVGVATAVVGVRWKQLWLTAIGAATAVVSGVVWATTFGIPDWLADALEAVELTGFDVAALGVFAVGVIIASWAVRVTTFASIWLFALPFGWVTITTIVAELDRHPIWVVPVAVVVGVTAVILGVQRKLAGPLLWGTVFTISVVVVASRLTLVLVPGWVWIGAGGVALLTTALVVERVAGGWAGVRRQARYLARTWR